MIRLVRSIIVPSVLTAFLAAAAADEPAPAAHPTPAPGSLEDRLRLLEEKNARLEDEGHH